MKLVLAGKYPPLEGQVSTVGYWLARGLAERGHEVTVVTNADEAEPAFRTVLDDRDGSWYAPRFAGSGLVRVLTTEPFGPSQFHIPPANPFVTKLAALALTAVREHGAQLVFSTYLEPYAVAGHLAATFADVPHVVTHSGSDIARLAANPGLGPVYAEIVAAGRFVPKSRAAEALDGTAQIRPPALKPYSPPEPVFNTSAAALDVNAFLHRHRDLIERELQWHTRPFDPRRFTFGIYGKLAEAKGIYDLVAALAALRRSGETYNVLIMSRWRRGEDRLRAALCEAGLEERAWLLPYLPNWHVPRFVRACDAVCHLERDWPTGKHVSIVPSEVTACGVCLIVSEEARSGPALRSLLVDGVSCAAVEDPRRTPELAARLQDLLERPDQARAIGAAGHESTRSGPSHDDFVTGWESVLATALSIA